MQKEFVTYEQALALKELGFDEKCLANYHFNKDLDISFWRHGMDTPAPLKQQAFKFFRDKFNLKQFVGWRPNVKKFDSHIVDMTLNGIEYAKSRGFKEFNSDLLFDDYDKAESHLIDLMIERAKQQ